jgi:cytochrome P450
VATETEDGMLDDEELLSFCRLLLIAGNETTTGLITAFGANLPRTAADPSRSSNSSLN